MLANLNCFQLADASATFSHLLKTLRQKKQEIGGTNGCSVSYRDETGMVTICTYPLVSEAFNKVSLNSSQLLLRNSSDKNFLSYYIEIKRAITLYEQSSNHNMVMICTSPLFSEIYYKVSLNSSQEMMRNNPIFFPCHII